MTTVQSAPAQNSDPDLKTEERFHHIYKKYNAHPTSVEAWEKALADRRSNTYSIQENDTLWGVSGTLFGESEYWPKVWSYNTKDILNPHQINPNQTIKFYPGTMAEAPTVGLAKKDDAPEALPSHVIEKKEDGSLESIQIPPPKRKSRPLVKKLPNSLPLYRLGLVNAPPPDVEVSGARPKNVPGPKYLSYYVVDASPAATGEVVEMEADGEETSGEYRHVVVRVSNAGDKRYVIYKDQDKISDPLGASEKKGTIVEIQGELELMERVNERENLFRALIKKSINAVEVGAKLMPGRVATFDSEASLVANSVQARIIGGEHQKFEHKMFGTDNIIFLNAGAQEGLQEGSTLKIFMNEKLRKPSTKAVENDRVIGILKVIKVSNHFSTGYVLDSASDIMIGDYAGGQARAPAAAASSNSSPEGEDLEFSAASGSSEDGSSVQSSEDEDLSLD